MVFLLKEFEKKIEKRKKKIRALEKEIDDLMRKNGIFKTEHCKYRHGDKCWYEFPEESCLDCFVCGEFKKKEDVACLSLIF